MNLNSVLTFVLQSFSLVLPIFMSGILLVWILRKNYVPLLNRPLDFGLTLGGKRLFGDNKTLRGIIVYVAGSIIICYALAVIGAYSSVVHPVFLSQPLLLGLVFSVSYICGELTNSFVKRRLSIAPGQQRGGRLQRVADNLDGVVMVALALVLVYNVAVLSVVVAGLVGSIIHVLTDVLMKRIGLKT